MKGKRLCSDPKLINVGGGLRADIPMVRSAGQGAHTGLNGGLMLDDQQQSQASSGKRSTQANQQRNRVSGSIGPDSHRQYRESRNAFYVVGGLPERQPGNNLIDVRDQLGGISRRLVGNTYRPFLMQPPQQQ
jgi:hypothetical protein